MNDSIHLDISHIFDKKILNLFCKLCGIIFLLCMLMDNAHAHKVNIFAFAENGKVQAEGYFVDGTKCKNSLIEVIDNKTGERLLEGNTNENGQFSFDIPRVTTIKLILHAGTGHQNEYILSEKEIEESMPDKKKSTKKQTTEQVEKKADKFLEKKSQDKEQTTAGHDVRGFTHQHSAEIEASIEKVIDRKLQPVIRILMNLQEKSEKPGVTEILGGIGYIIGIVGIFAYFKRKSVKHDSERDK
jgi:nickel transport protein